MAARESVQFDFLSHGASELASDFKKTGDSATLAAKGARLLADSLDKQRRAADASAGATLAQARADKILADAEDQAIAKSVEERIAVEKAAAAKRADAEAAKQDAEATKKAADAHKRLAAIGKSLGGLAGGAGLFGAGAAAVGLAGPLGAATTALAAFGAVAVPELTKVEQALTKTGKARKAAFAALSGPEKQLAGDVKDLKDQFHVLETSLAPVIDTLVKFGGTLLRDAMPGIRQLATAGAGVIKAFLGPLDTFVKSKTFTSLAAQLSSLAVQAGKILGPQLVQLVKVFLQLFVQVGPSGIRMLKALLPSIVQLTAALTPAIVWVSKLTAGFLAFANQKHLIIPLLGLIAAGFLAISAGGGPIFATVAAIAVLVGAITYTAKHWSQVWSGIKQVAADAAKYLRIAFDGMELMFLLWAKTFVHGAADAFGWVPGLGSKLKEADRALASFIASTEARLHSLTSRSYAIDFHLSLPAGVTAGSSFNNRRKYASGTPGAAPGWAWVGERGPELINMRGGETVIPNHALGGYAAGTGEVTVHLSLPSLTAMGRVLGGAVAAIVSSVRQNAAFTGGFGRGSPLSGAGVYSQRALEALWIGAGGPPGLAHLMAAIADAESGGKANAYNASGASGLWQILGQIVPGNIFNPFVNAANAVAKWRTQGLGAWVTYTSGAYKQYYDQGGYLNPGWTLAYNGTGRPEMVVPNRGGGGGGQVVLEVRGGGGELDQMFLTWLRRAVRVRGGNVQTVLGRN